MLPRLLAVPGVEIMAVLRSRGERSPEQQRRFRRRKLLKLLQVGALGALNGIRMRRWYDLGAESGCRDIGEIAKEAGVAYTEWGRFAQDDCRAFLRSLDCDLALSLGNGYIPKSVFDIPRLGSLNVHHELLPAMRGAQSVIWQLHQGSSTTGFTIHRIDAGIDTGAIVRCVALPIVFGRTLEQTVKQTYVALVRASADALADILVNPESIEESRPQAAGNSFTTPTIWQFARMVRQHARLSKGKTEGPTVSL